MKIGFYQPHLCLRGTTVAMFDYAFYNQTILGNESIIFYDKNDTKNHKTVIEKFSIFKLIELDSIKELDKNINIENIDSIYIVKGGRKDDGRNTNACKSLIHVIGVTPSSEKHGDVYAYASKWLSDTCSGGSLPSVPYMVDLPNIDEDLRDTLGIPKNAYVFGRNGGQDTWNIPFANKTISDVLDKRNDIYFLFQNTPIPFNHRKIIHLPSTSDMIFKTKFINTCDAMIHARYEGESFGLSCGEFSIRNKPIITWLGSPERNHIEILGDKGIYYNDESEMKNKILNFEKYPDKDWNCYKEFNPANIMDIFKEVYLDGKN
jgi:hypothetical protein